MQGSYQEICLVSMILDIRLNTLIFMFSKTSGMHHLAYELLIYLEVPLYLFTILL